MLKINVGDYSFNTSSMQTSELTEKLLANLDNFPTDTEMLEIRYNSGISNNTIKNINKQAIALLPALGLKEVRMIIDDSLPLPSGGFGGLSFDEILNTYIQAYNIDKDTALKLMDAEYKIKEQIKELHKMFKSVKSKCKPTLIMYKRGQ